VAVHFEPDPSLGTSGECSCGMTMLEPRGSMISSWFRQGMASRTDLVGPLPIRGPGRDTGAPYGLGVDGWEDAGENEREYVSTDAASSSWSW